MRTEMFVRSARGRHKMCPECRSLVPRSAGTCPECGASLAMVRGPGLGRALGNLFPGLTGTTGLILLANGILFALMLATPGYDLGAGPPPEGLRRLWQFDGGTLYRFGACIGGSLETGQWWRLVAPIFLHGGILHFAFNSMVFLQLAPLVEREYGTDRFAVIYVGTGVVSFVFSEILSGRPTVGASGAVCGLVGLLLVHGARRGAGALRSAMGQYALYVLVFSFLPGVSLTAHLGGFLAGAAFGAVVPWGPARSRGAALAWQILALGCLLLVLAAFWMVARHGNEVPAAFFRR